VISENAIEHGIKIPIGFDSFDAAAGVHEIAIFTRGLQGLIGGVRGGWLGCEERKKRNFEKNDTCGGEGTECYQFSFTHCVDTLQMRENCIHTRQNWTAIFGKVSDCPL